MSLKQREEIRFQVLEWNKLEQFTSQKLKGLSAVSR
jgi:hypothetical protein